MSGRLDLRPSLFRAVDALETETAIMAWVLDPLNAGNVREVATAFLLDDLKNRARHQARRVEVAARVDPIRASAGISAELTHREALIAAGYPEWDLDADGKPKRDFLATVEGEAWKQRVPVGLQLVGRAAMEARTARLRREKDEASEARSARLGENMRRAIEEWKQAVIIEWSQELLTSTFMVDGQQVTWGDATAAQHQARADHLASRAAGTIETAALHMKAVERIREAAAGSLNQAAAVAA